MRTGEVPPPTTLQPIPRLRAPKNGPRKYRSPLSSNSGTGVCRSRPVRFTSGHVLPGCWYSLGRGPRSPRFATKPKIGRSGSEACRQIRSSNRKRVGSASTSSCPKSSWVCSTYWRVSLVQVSASLIPRRPPTHQPPQLRVVDAMPVIVQADGQPLPEIAEPRQPHAVHTHLHRSA